MGARARSGSATHTQAQGTDGLAGDAWRWKGGEAVDDDMLTDDKEEYSGEASRKGGESRRVGGRAHSGSGARGCQPTHTQAQGTNGLAGDAWRWKGGEAVDDDVDGRQGRVFG